MEISTLRAEESLPEGEFDSVHYCSVHHHLFQDVYDWAVLRDMAINAMQKEGSNGSLRGKFKRAGWDDDDLFRLLELF